jgi:hypothetical protein
MSCQRRGWLSRPQHIDHTLTPPPPDPDQVSRTKHVAEAHRMVPYATVCASNVTMAVVSRASGITHEPVGPISVQRDNSCIVARIDPFGRLGRFSAFVWDQTTNASEAHTAIDSFSSDLNPPIYLQTRNASGVITWISMLVDPHINNRQLPTENTTFYDCAFAVQTDDPMRELSISDLPLSLDIRSDASTRQ